MFSKERKPTLLRLETDRAIRHLTVDAIGSEEYVKTLDVVIKLHGLLANEKPSSVSRDTLTVVGANLLGIFMIIKHESLNVITSRAMQLVLRPRV